MVGCTDQGAVRRVFAPALPTKLKDIARPALAGPHFGCNRRAAGSSFAAFRGNQMPIYTIAKYRVRPSGVDKVKRAIEEFVPYVTQHEPGTRMYLAWQQQDDPTRFVHFFI